MASQHDDDLDNTGTPPPTGSLSRRQVLTASLVAAGAGAATLAAAPAAFAAGRPVAETQPGTTAAEFRARFAQTGPTGEHFTAYGYLTAADGATDDDLFAGASLNDTTALLTAYAKASSCAGRSIRASTRSTSKGRSPSISAPTPGASFADPGFVHGWHAGCDLRDHAAGHRDGVRARQGAPDADRRHAPDASRRAQRLRGRAEFRTRRRGKRGSLRRASARCSNPVTFNSVLEMAGNWTTK